MAEISAEDCALARIARASGVVHWEADPATFAFTFVSEQAEALLGFPRTEWVRERRFWRKRTHPDDQLETIRLCHAAIARHEAHALIYRMLAADGREVWVENHVTCIVEGGVVTKLCGVLLDVTERRQREAGSRTAAHELNNALGTILGNAEIARESLADTQFVDECLVEVERASQLAATIVKDRLIPARPSGGVGRPRAAATKEPAHEAHHVVVVDDDPAHARILTRALTRDGHRVTTVYEPEAALAALAANDVDLLVTDFDMPRLTGLDLAREARRANPELVIILLSGGGPSDLGCQAGAAGIDRYLAKPVAIEELRTVVRQTLEPTSPASAPRVAREARADREQP